MDKEVQTKLKILGFDDPDAFTGDQLAQLIRPFGEKYDFCQGATLAGTPVMIILEKGGAQKLSHKDTSGMLVEFRDKLWVNVLGRTLAYLIENAGE